MFFSVDGLEDTNNMYRRGVLWDRIDANIRAYTGTGAKGMWDYLMFEYNKHQIEQAKDQCKEWGDECVLFEKEADMLQAFLDLIQDSDILSGWNSEGYDIPYTVNTTNVEFMTKTESYYINYLSHQTQ